MAEEKRLYIPGSVTGSVIIDQNGRAVPGFVITFTIVELSEEHSIQIVTMDSVAIDNAIRHFIANRLAIADLG